MYDWSKKNQYWILLLGKRCTLPKFKHKFEEKTSKAKLVTKVEKNCVLFMFLCHTYFIVKQLCPHINDFCFEMKVFTSTLLFNLTVLPLYQ